MPWCLLKRQNIRINPNISVGNCSFLSHAVILLVPMYQCVSVKQFNLSLFIHTLTVNSTQLNFALEQIKHLFLNNATPIYFLENLINTHCKSSIFQVLCKDLGEE